jgi:hypothetical protein
VFGRFVALGRTPGRRAVVAGLAEGGGVVFVFLGAEAGPDLRDEVLFFVVPVSVDAGGLEYCVFGFE